MRRDAPRLRVTLLRARFGQVGKGCAMWARFADFRSEFMAYVDVLQGPGKRLWLFRPFDGSFVQDFHAEGDQLWCLGRFRKGQDDGSQIVRYDLNTGQEKARAWVGGTWHGLQRFGVSKTIALIGYGEVAFIDPHSLGLRSRFDQVWTFNAVDRLGSSVKWRPFTKTDTPEPRVVIGDVLVENPDGSIRAYWTQFAASPRRSDPTLTDPRDFAALDGWFSMFPDSGMCQPHLVGLTIEDAPIRSRSSAPKDMNAPKVAFRRFLGAGDDPHALPDGTWPEGFWPELTSQDTGPLLAGPVSVAGWTVEAVTIALTDLASRIETDLDGLRGRGDGLMLTFHVAGDYLDDWAFFDRLREHRLDVTDAVRRLLRTYSATIRSREIVLAVEDGSKAGPMGAAMGWLMAQTDDCANELRDFVIYRDGEHDKASVNNLLLPYVAKRDYCDAQAWRLGILVALLYDRDGVSFYQDGKGISSWMQSGVLPATRDRIAPEVFAAHIAAEAADFLTHPDVFAAFGTHADTLSNSLQSLELDLGRSAWDLACRTALARAFPDMIDATPLSEPRQLSVLEKFSDAFFRLWNSK